MRSDWKIVLSVVVCSACVDTALVPKPDIDAALDAGLAAWDEAQGAEKPSNADPNKKSAGGTGSQAKPAGAAAKATGGAGASARAQPSAAGAAGAIAGAAGSVKPVAAEEAPVVETALPSQAGQLVISELMIDPKTSSDTQGEWFELYNASAVRLDLLGCEIDDGAKSPHTLTESVQVEPGAYVTVARDAAIGFIPSTLADISLSNTADTLALRCGGVEIDRVDYDRARGFPLSSGASLALDPGRLSAADNDNPAAWCNGQDSYGPELGSPGNTNPTCAAEMSPEQENPAVPSPPPASPQSPPQPAPQPTPSTPEHGTAGRASVAPPTAPAPVPPAAGHAGGTSTSPPSPQPSAAGAAGAPAPHVPPVAAPTPPAAPAVPSPSQAGDIVITELMIDPQSTSDTAGEWLELYNASPRTLELQGCEIDDGSSAARPITERLLVSSGTYVTIARQPNPGFAADATLAISLGNTVDTVALRCAGLEIDRVTYDKAANYPLVSGASSALDPQHSNSVDNDLASAWCSSRDSYGPELGTPGSANPPCQTLVAETQPTAPSEVDLVVQMEPTTHQADADDNRDAGSSAE